MRLRLSHHQSHPVAERRHLQEEERLLGRWLAGDLEHLPKPEHGPEMLPLWQGAYFWAEAFFAESGFPLEHARLKAFTTVVHLRYKPTPPVDTHGFLQDIEYISRRILLWPNEPTYAFDFNRFTEAYQEDAFSFFETDRLESALQPWLADSAQNRASWQWLKNSTA